MTNLHEQPWVPLTPDEAYKVFAGFAAPWWIAGGWALDLYLGRQTRRHGDLDVLIRRDHQLLVRRHLSGWDLHKTNQPGLKPWADDDFLRPPINSIWCRRAAESPWCLELMLMETADDEWVFRRNNAIRGPLNSLGRKTDAGIPYLAPEIQLLYKARPELLEKDKADFNVVAPCLEQAARKWLLDALQQCFSNDHPWIVWLTGMNGSD